MSECVQRCLELLRRRTPKDAENALEAIAEALHISPYSEKLLEMRAQFLFMVRNLLMSQRFCRFFFFLIK